MRRASCLAATVAAALLAFASQAPAAELQKGTFELGLSALLQDADQTGLYFNATSRIGYALTPHHEAGATVSVLWVKPDNQGSIAAGTLGGFYRFNFSTSDRYLVPFLGANVYTFLGDLRQSMRWGWQIESGLRYLPTPAAGINAAIVWRREFSKADYIVTDRSFGMTVGLSLFL
jgi:hypothetical protein